MSRLGRLWNVVTHPRELRLALSGLATRLGGDDAMGGLAPDEAEALARWVRGAAPDVFVEIGTLFGFTARKIARDAGVRVLAVDNFSWNPFGLTPEQHAAFTRRVVEGADVEIVRSDAAEFLDAIAERVNPARSFVFLDGSHAYADVKGEVEACIRRGVRPVAGHDFGRERFGVTQAVRDVVGEPDEVVGTCWLKRIGG